MPLHPDTKRIAVVLIAALAGCAWMADISFRVGAIYALMIIAAGVSYYYIRRINNLSAAIVLIVIAATYISGLLRIDSLASWIIGILFIDELIIVAIIVAAAIFAMKDGRKIRTIYRTKR